MHDILASVELLGLSGSLRKDSFSRATSIGLRDNLPGKGTRRYWPFQLSSWGTSSRDQKYR